MHCWSERGHLVSVDGVVAEEALHLLRNLVASTSVCGSQRCM